MSKKSSSSGPVAHWHIDCRIESELPEDNIVRTRFLINVLFSALAVGGLLLAGWLGALDLSTRHQIRDWEDRINENRNEIREIQRMQIEYAAEAAKVDEAYRLIKPQLYVSGFIATLGHLRPEPLMVDSIEWSDQTILMRGSIKEKSDRASLLLSNYVKALNKDEKMSEIFGEIRLTSFDRGTTGDDTINFEIAFKLKGTPKT